MMFLKSLTRFSTKLSEIALDEIGNRNPQLMREWQGRLRWRNLLLTLGLSFTVQALLLLQRFSQSPDVKSHRTRYCFQVSKDNVCQLGANGFPVMDWPVVWADAFRDLSYAMVWVLIIVGVYLLAADIFKETRRGTLNFLRMSPLSGRRILLGKLLGVPVLLYVGIGACLPLHVATGLMGSYPLGHLLMFYGLLGAIALCLYTGALWFTLLTKGLQGFQTWLISGLSACVLFLGWLPRQEGSAMDWFRLFNPLHILADWQIERATQPSMWPFGQGESLNGFRDLGWFFLPVGSHVSGYLVLALANALVLGIWSWVLLERKFQTPVKTALGKQQSYVLTLCFSLIFMGFNLQESLTAKHWDQYSLNEYLESYIVAMLFYCVALIFLLLPAKQVLLDWARYRHQRPQSKAHKTSRQHHGFLSDWRLRDDSPSVLAFAINLGIVAGILLLGLTIMAFGNQVNSAIVPVLEWGVCCAVLLTCAFVVQLISLSNLLHWRWLAFGAVAAITLGWPLALEMSGISHTYGIFQFLWLTTLFPRSLTASISWAGLGGAILIHLTLITSLSLFLGRRCQRLGESEWKALMNARATKANA